MEVEEHEDREEKTEKPGFIRRMSMRLSKRNKRSKPAARFEEITKPAGYEHEDLHKIMKRLKQEINDMKSIHHDWEKTTKRPKLDHDFKEHVEHVYSYASMIATRVGVSTVQREVTDGYEMEISKLKDDIRDLKRENYNDKRLQDRDFEIQRLKREVETLRNEIRNKRQSESDQMSSSEGENRRHSRGRTPRKDENGAPDTSKYIIHDLKDKSDKLTKDLQRLTSEKEDLVKQLEDTMTDNKELSKRNFDLKKEIDQLRNQINKLENNGTEESTPRTRTSVSSEDTANGRTNEDRENRQLQRVDSYKKEISHLQKQNHEKDRIIRQNESTIDRLQHRIREEKKAKEEALDRLTERASLNMRSANPNITDLSDPHRPLKIAEKYSELYDNQWTNAMENLEEKGIDEEKGIQILLNIITSLYTLCQDYGKRQLEQFEILVYNPFMHSDPEAINRNEITEPLSNDEIKILREHRKKIADVTIPLLQKKLRAELLKGKLSNDLLEACEGYVDECVRYCWLMTIQDPPLHLSWEFENGILFNHDIMKSYTKSGNCVSFVVWPVLFLHKNGNLLCKGVVQGFNRTNNGESAV